MTERDKLFDLFGFWFKPNAKPAAKKSSSRAAKPAAAQKQSGTSKTVFDLDKWDQERGDELWQAQPQGEVKSKLDGAAFSDLFGAMFLDAPQYAPGGCIDDVRERFIKGLMESPEAQGLRARTIGRDYAASAAAEKYAASLAEMVKSDTPNNNATNERKAARAIAKATSEAQDAVDETENVLGGLGFNNEPGANESKSDRAEIAAVFHRVRNSRRLAAIMEMAGKFRRAAQAKQRQKTLHGNDEMIGVELSGDISRLLPVELAQLADETFELDAMRRLVEKQSFCREYRGVEKIGRGPIIVCVDESGSMDDDSKIIKAKAFALAMAWIARHQKRYCCLSSFSSSYQGRYHVLPASGEWQSTELMAWLEGFFGGGTNLEYPMRTIPQMIDQLGAPKGKTDFILVTDAGLEVDADLSSWFTNWKAANKAKLHSLVLDRDGGSLASISDEIVVCEDLNLESVDSCLSI